MGAYSGYDVLFQNMAKDYPDFLSLQTTWKENTSISILEQKALGRLKRYSDGSPYYNLHSLKAELNALVKTYRKPSSIFHIAYMENNLGLGKFYHKLSRTNKIATAHQPPGWWKLGPAKPAIVKLLDRLIVLDSRSKEYFSNYINPDKIDVIHHGIDTEFFVPLDVTYSEKEEIKCVFTGQWLRDIEKLNCVIENVNSAYSTCRISFHLIYPDSNRFNNSVLYKLSEKKNVYWYSNLTDQELLSVYQSCDILFIPLIDCTANNGVLEAMATGLPIVTTDVGGIRDYVDESFAFLSNKTDELTEHILYLARDQKILRSKATQARRYAVENFDWSVIVPKVVNLYQSI